MSFIFYLLVFAKVEMCACCAGSSTFRKMAEVGPLQRLSEWKRAERIPVGGNELVIVQLVQQVNRLNKHCTCICVSFMDTSNKGPSSSLHDAAAIRGTFQTVRKCSVKPIRCRLHTSVKKGS